MYTVIVPVLNEVDNIETLIRRLDPKYGEVIFCDNGSVDGTVPLVSLLGKNNPRIKLNQGSGSVADAIYRGVSNASFPYVVVLDGDLSHPPELVSTLADLLKTYDFVSGSRYLNGIHSRDTFINRIFSLGLNLVTFPLDPRMTDRSTGFFGVRRNLVKNPFKSYCKPALEIKVTCPIISSKEIGYDFSLRAHGRSKLGRSKSVPITIQDVLVLYIKKYNSLIKYAMVGSIGTGIYLGLLAFFTQVVGIWYFYSAIIGTTVAFFFNYSFNRLWTFKSTDSKRTDPDYEYVSWYNGNFVQKFWKRRIAQVTLSKIPNNASVLDIGCGSSPMLGMIPGKVTGLDRDSGKLAYQKSRSRNGTELIKCDLSSGDFPKLPKVTNIVCNNVLEHLDDPESVISWMSSELVSSGSLIITVPDYSSKFTAIVEKVYDKVMPGAYAEDHCYQFTEQSLDTMCKNYGLKLSDRKRVLTDMVCTYTKI